MEADSKRSELSQRLRRLPGQFLLALVNATSLLVIAAAVLAIVALNHVNNAAAALADTVTDTVIAKFDFDPARLANSVEKLDEEIGALRLALVEGRAEWPHRIEDRIDVLTQSLTALNATLTNASAQLTDQAIRQAGDSITDGLLRLRNCQAALIPAGGDAGPMVRPNISPQDDADDGPA